MWNKINNGPPLKRKEFERVLRSDELIQYLLFGSHNVLLVFC
jgi:hypothetical protein